MNYASSLDVKDAVMTPVIEVNASVTLRFNIRFSPSGQLILEVRTTSKLGLIQRKMADFRVDGKVAKTLNGEVCLPTGEFRLVFLVDGHNFVHNSNGSDFVRVTGLEKTNNSCTVEENDSDTGQQQRKSLLEICD